VNLGLKRPGSGIPAIHFWQWLGKKSVAHYEQNDLITEL
jgi:hypothetical protein